jgi:hypothetical protein
VREGSINSIGTMSAPSGRAELIGSVRTRGADQLDQRCVACGRTRGSTEHTHGARSPGRLTRSLARSASPGDGPMGPSLDPSPRVMNNIYIYIYRHTVYLY